MDPSVTPSQQLDWVSILTHSGPIAATVMIILMILSVWAWMIIISKIRVLSKMQRLSEKFLTQFWEAKSFSELNAHVKDMVYSPAREVFRAGFNEMIRVLQIRDKKHATNPMAFDTVRRALARQKMIEESLLSSNISILAICASAGPFIGLFGTVVGIIRAFHEIGMSGSSSLAAVAPGISEALVATALGLFVAIPAVVFYNVLSSKIRKHLVLLDSFSSDFMNILERHYSIQKTEHDS